MRYIIVGIVFVLLLLMTVTMVNYTPSSDDGRQDIDMEHVYASWDTMEFDKYVAAWLIMRFIDPNAEFVFYPHGTEIIEGTAFDVPGAAWSRKHRKCTSQCIWESIKKTDPAAERIVSIAGKVELNFWQLGRWPDAQSCFDDVQKIIAENSDFKKSLEQTTKYFDALYERLKEENSSLEKEI